MRVSCRSISDVGTNILPCHAGSPVDWNGNNVYQLRTVSGAATLASVLTLRLWETASSFLETMFVCNYVECCVCIEIVNLCSFVVIEFVFFLQVLPAHVVLLFEFRFHGFIRR